MMNENPLVSIIIPTYNRAHLIGETLDSVLAQTYQNWECIIVDDGSSDNSDDVVGAYAKKDKRFKYYHRPEEHLPGGNGARNYGFKMSQGEYVNWFDSDDLMVEDFLENKVLNFKLGFDLQISITGVFASKIGDNPSLWNSYRGMHDKVCLVNEFLKQNMQWSTLGAFWNRKFILKNDMIWNEDILIWQDWLFHIEAILKDCKIQYLKSVDNFTRISNKNDKISTKEKSIKFISDLNLAIYRSLILFTRYNFLNNVKTSSLNLIARILIKLPIQNGYYKFAIIRSIKYAVLLKSLFPLKSFILELARQYSITRKISNFLYKPYKQRVKFDTTFMKLTKEDLNK